MSVDIATIALEVKTDGMAAAIKKMRDLEKDSEKTEKSFSKVGNASSQLSSSLKKLEKNSEKTEKSIEKAGSASSNLSSQFTKLNTHTENVKNNIKKVDDQLEHFEKNAGKTEKSFGKVGNASSQLSSQLMKLGAAVGGLMAIRKAMDFSRETISLASDLEETQGKFDVVFRGMTKTAEGWSKSLRNSYAMSETESKRYLSSLQDLLVPTGMLRENAGELSNQFVKMAADLGSFNNRATAEVIMDIQSALQGSSETMAKYGINVKVAKLEQEILNAGMVASKKDITDAHKAQAIYNIMMREGADAVGDMERTSGSYANQMKKFNASTEDFKTNIGKGLLPVATQLITALNNWSAANENLLNQKISEYAENLSDGLKYVIDNFDEIKDEISFLAKELLEAGKILMRVAGIFVQVGQKIGGALKTIIDVWDSVPDFVKQKGVISALFGGVQGVSALADLSRALDLMDKQAEKTKTEIIIRRDANKTVMGDAASLAMALQKISDKELEHKQANLKKEVADRIAANKEMAEWHKQAEKELRKQLKPETGIKVTDIETTGISDEESKKRLRALQEYEVQLAKELNFKIGKMAHERSLAVEESIIDQYEIEWDEYENLKKKIEGKSKGASFNFADDDLSNMANMITGVGNLTKAWEEYAETLREINELKVDMAQKAELTQIAEDALLRSQIAGYGNLAGAASKYFEEGSTARKNLHNLEMALGAIEIAMEAKKVAASLAGIATTVAAKLSEATVLAGTAILNQAIGEPYSAFARMAAMAAMVGGVLAAMGAGGISFGGGSGGGGGSSNPPEMTKTTGTVLGMPDKASESLSNSLSILEDFGELQYAELKGIYDQLKTLNQNLTGILNSIVRDVGVFESTDFKGFGGSSADMGDEFTSNFLGEIPELITNMGIGDAIRGIFGDGEVSTAIADVFDFAGNVVSDSIAGAVNYAFGGETEKNLINAGIEIAKVSFKDVKDGVQVGVKKFGVVETIVDKGAFRDRDMSYETVYEDATDKTQQMFNLLFQNTVSTMEKFATDLEVPIEEVLDFTANIQKVDLTGLDAEEASKKLEEWYSTLLDKAFKSIFEDRIGKYHQEGEGLAETAVRLITGLQLIKTAMSQTGVAFTATGDGAIDASNKLTIAAGSLTEFADLVNGFYKDFTTDGEKLIDTKNQLQAEFDKLDIEMPDSKEGFKTLIASIDLADENSHALYLRLMELAPSFAEVAEATEEYNSKLVDMRDWMSGFGPSTSNLSKQFRAAQEDMESFRKEIEDTGNVIPEGWEKGGAVEDAVKQWIQAMEKYSISLDITSDMFSAIADEQTKLDYEHWQRLQQINELTKATGDEYPDLIASATELYDLRKRQLDEEINTVWELKSFYEDLSQRINSLQSSIKSQADSFKTKDQVASEFGQLTQQYNELDPTSQDYLEQSTTLLEQIWETGNELYSMEDKAMQELLEVQKNQLQVQIDTLDEQKASIEKQIGTLKQIETFLFDLTGGSLAPVQSEEGMMKQYDKLLLEAKKSGDISDLESFIKGGFFEFFKAYGNYKDINAMVINDIASLGDDISGGATLDDLQSQLETLNGTIENINSKMSGLTVQESSINGLNLEEWTKSLLPIISETESQINTVIEGLDSEITTLNVGMLSLVQAIDTWGDNLSAQNIFADNQILVDSQSLLKESIDQLNNTVSYAFMDQLPVEQIVNSAYQNLFGRSPSESGLDWWTTQLESGTIAMSNFKDTLIAGAGSNDLKYYNENIQNRASMSNAGENAQMIAQVVGQAIASAGVNADVHVYIDEKEIKDVMVKVTRKDNEYQKEIKRAVKVA